MNLALPVIAVIMLVVYVFSSAAMYDFLKKRNEKIESFIFIRLFLFKYVNQYRKITLNETGKPGVLYYLWIGSINVVLLIVVIMLITKTQI